MESELAKISLFNPYKSKDYQFVDRITAENFHIGGVGVIVHKYVGPKSGGDETTIDDILLLENRDRKYDQSVYNIKCFYTPQDSDFDLSQFGIFLSSDVIRIDFHLTDMTDSLGRKLMSGDVLEFVHLRDVTLDGTALNKFYVVQEGLFSSAGFGPSWYPHVWKVKAKEMTDSQEYKDIVKRNSTGHSAGGLGDGTGLMPINFSGGEDCSLKASISTYCKTIGISDKLIGLAEEDVMYDPKYVEARHLYVQLSAEGYPLLTEWTGGTNEPPNGAPLKGVGVEFPEDMTDGEYFLRIDFAPDRLFQKQGNRYVKIYDDVRKYWTAYDSVHDSFIDNNNVTTFNDGTKITEKQGISQALKPKAGLNAAHKKKIKTDRAESEQLSQDRYEGKKPL